MRQLLLGRVSSTARKRRRWSGELPFRFAPLVSHQRCAPNRRTLACFHPAPKFGYHLADSRYAGYRRQIWPWTSYSSRRRALLERDHRRRLRRISSLRFPLDLLNGLTMSIAIPLPPNRTSWFTLWLQSDCGNRKLLLSADGCQLILTIATLRMFLLLTITMQLLDRVMVASPQFQTKDL